ncbi:MAG: hypothetical protein PHH77_02560 [Victivallaceae bacterium]|nr:hypothetical protein [Victivallaceae bacterium]
MRIIQRFDVRCEDEFMKLEKKFAELESRRADYPQGRRMKPLAASEPCNSLIWEAEFPDLNAAHAALHFFSEDAEHEALRPLQLRFFEKVKIEFYENL